MALSAEALNAGLQMLVAGYSETFTEYHPAFSEFAAKGTSKELGEAYISWSIVPEEPGTITEMVTGNELIATGTGGSSRRAHEYVSTAIYGLEILGEELRQVSTKADITKLLRDRPARGMKGFKNVFAKHFAVGGVSSLPGFVHLNGDRTYNPHGLGARTGIISFAARASQTGNLHGITRNTVQGWSNPQGEISSFLTDGLETFRDVVWDIQEEGGEQGDGKGPTLGFCSRDHFANHISRLDDQVIYIKTAESGDWAPDRYRDGIVNTGVRLYVEKAFTASEFTTAAAQEGVCVLLTPEEWMWMHKNGSGTAGGGTFQMSPAIHHPDFDKLTYRIYHTFGAACKSPRKQGAIVGGGRA